MLIPQEIVSLTSWHVSEACATRGPKRARCSRVGSAELAESWLPFRAATVEAFGTGRCMFESNFLVDKECVSYRTLWNAFKRIVARLQLSAKDKATLFHDTITRGCRVSAEVAPAAKGKHTL